MNTGLFFILYLKLVGCCTALKLGIFQYRFLRGIAYREFTRLVHGYLGGRRIPLPACCYHAIRRTFPDTSDYAGFETEDA